MPLKNITQHNTTQPTSTPTGLLLKLTWRSPNTNKPATHLAFGIIPFHLHPRPITQTYHSPRAIKVHLNHRILPLLKATRQIALLRQRCTKCHRQLKHRRTQYRHFKECHTNESQHTCPYCKRLYSRKASLDKHLRNKHVGDQTMESRSNLKQHGYRHAIPGHGLFLR